jgi:hypothetical protein
VNLVQAEGDQVDTDAHAELQIAGRGTNRGNDLRVPQRVSSHASSYNRGAAMTAKIWLENAMNDAERRGLAGMRPLLEALARSISTLRTADWNFDATGEDAEQTALDAR